MPFWAVVLAKDIFVSPRCSSNGLLPARVISRVPWRDHGGLRRLPMNCTRVNQDHVAGIAGLRGQIEAVARAMLEVADWMSNRCGIHGMHAVPISSTSECYFSVRADELGPVQCPKRVTSTKVLTEREDRRALHEPLPDSLRSSGTDATLP